MESHYDQRRVDKKRRKMSYHKVKKEKVDSGKYDLTHYTNDRVELLQKVFKILKPNEIKSMLPDCVRDVSLDNIQELCLEELLGMSGKRLYAVLDGTEPPSDTNSSGEEPLEHMSLDSISSGEVELHSGTSSKSKKKKRCKRKEDKRKKSKKSDKVKSETNGEKSKEEGAGLTVLELLELHARARAIRAQLVVEQANRGDVEPEQANISNGDGDGDDDEVLIKEEPREVVELISTDDETSDLVKLEKVIKQQPDLELPEATTLKPAPESTLTVTRRNDLTIIVPKQITKKIKLNRTRYTTTNNKTTDISDTTFTADDTLSSSDTTLTSKRHTTTDISTSNQQHKTPDKQHHTTNEQQTKRRRKKRKSKTKDGSDDDEIKLELSDSERQDLMEYFDSNKQSQRSEYSSDTSDNDTTHANELETQVRQNTSNGYCRQQANVVTSDEIEKSSSTIGSEHKDNTDQPVTVNETGEKCITSEVKEETIENTEVNQSD